MTQVYIHKQKGDLVLITDCYVLEAFSGSLSSATGCFSHVGVLLENENGVTFLLPDGVLEYFELIGEM